MPSLFTPEDLALIEEPIESNDAAGVFREKVRRINQLFKDYDLDSSEMRLNIITRGFEFQGYYTAERGGIVPLRVASADSYQDALGKLVTVLGDLQAAKPSDEELLRRELIALADQYRGREIDQDSRDKFTALVASLTSKGRER